MPKKYLFYISQNYSFAILRPIQAVLRERGDEVCWFFEGHSANPAYLTTDERKLDSVEDVNAFNPDAVLVPANSVPTFIPGLKVAVFHGFDAGKLDSHGRNDHFKVRGCFDLYCTQGPSTTEPFKKLQQQYGFFNVIETGWSALDPLFEVDQQPSASAKPTVLLCSTFSKRLSCARPLYDTVADISRSGRWNWLVQFHPKMDPDVIDLYRGIQGEHLQYVETDNVIPLLKQADIMVCDTSSVIPMFLVQNKPVVTLNNINPGPYLLDINDPALLEPSIEKALKRPASLMQQISDYIAQTHPYSDARSSRRVVAAIDDVLAGKFPLSRRKPLNLLRNLKFRKRLGYWKL